MRQSARHPTYRRGCHQITCSVIERLNRKRDGFLGGGSLHAAIGDSRAHLDQAIETSACRPRTGPTISIQGHVNQARRESPACFSIVTQTIERSWTIAM